MQLTPAQKKEFQAKNIKVMGEPVVIEPSVKLGKNVKIGAFVNLYGCEIGDNSIIGAFTEIRKTVKIGKNVKIQAGVFIPEGVVIEDGVFIGPHVVFTNDKYPRAVRKDGSPETSEDWTTEKTLVKKGANIGSNATILSKITIGENAVIGAGSVVTRNVPANVTVAGVPARVLRASGNPPRALARKGED